MLTTTFWIIVSFSDYSHNAGNMDELSVHFPSEYSCQLTLEQLNELYDPEWSNHYIDCVKVEL